MSEFVPHPDANLFDLVARWITTALNPAASRIERGAAARRLASLGPDALRRLELNEDWQFVRGALAGARPSGELPGDGPWSRPSTDDPTPEAAAMSQSPEFQQSGATPFWCDFTPDRKRLLQDDFGDELPQLRIPCTRDSSPETIVAACASAVVGPLVATPTAARALPWASLSTGYVLDHIGNAWPMREDLLTAFWQGVVEDRAAVRGLPRRLAASVLWAIGKDGAPWAWFVDAWNGVGDLMERSMQPDMTVEAFASLHLAARADVARRARDAEVMSPLLLAVTSLTATSMLYRYASELDLLEAWRRAGGDPLDATEQFRYADAATTLCMERAVTATNLIPSHREWMALAPIERDGLRLVARRIAEIPDLAEQGVLTLRADPGGPSPF